MFVYVCSDLCCCKLQLYVANEKNKNACTFIKLLFAFSFQDWYIRDGHIKCHLTKFSFRQVMHCINDLMAICKWHG